MIKGVGLVLEGGGMRGVYSAGVLEYFLEREIFFPYVIGVSAGACNAASYLSRQKGRNHTVNIKYATDPRYLSWRNFVKKREIFGMDFIFNEIPNSLVPYDYEAFYSNQSEFVIGTTDCLTGKPVYYAKKDYGSEMLTVLKASSSLPLIAPEVSYNDRVLLDGGISDPIPIKKAQTDGYKKNIVILTQNIDYEKKPTRYQFLIKRLYPNYKGLQKAIETRYKTYNDTISHINQEEKSGNIIVLRPKEPLEVGRLERDPRKLERLFNRGYEDAKTYEKLIRDF
jgi:predicted patatin/cPLA2 family phospholipase